MRHSPPAFSALLVSGCMDAALYVQPLEADVRVSPAPLLLSGDVPCGETTVTVMAEGRLTSMVFVPEQGQADSVNLPNPEEVQLSGEFEFDLSYCPAPGEQTTGWLQLVFADPDASVAIWAEEE